MLRIAHVIHPGEVPKSSDLTIAQPITFASMVAARDYAVGKVDVKLYAIKHHDESLPSLPGFEWLPDLERSVHAFQAFKEHRKLAIINDILLPLYDQSDADTLIYTNVDIGLQPHFYLTVAQLIMDGTDAIVINRRTISTRHTTVDKLPYMYAETGEPHGGYDCFIFPRRDFPKYRLEGICIGTGWIGFAMMTNLIRHSQRFREIRDLHATFHLGNDKAWTNPAQRDYWHYNRREFCKILNHYMDDGQEGSHPELRRFAEVAREGTWRFETENEIVEKCSSYLDDGKGRKENRDVLVIRLCEQKEFTLCLRILSSFAPQLRMRVLATRIPSLPGVSRHAASFSQKLRELVRGCLDKREAIVIDERGRTGGFWDVLSKVLLGRNRITSVSVTPYADAVMEDA